MSSTRALRHPANMSRITACEEPSPSLKAYSSGVGTHAGVPKPFFASRYSRTSLTTSFA